MKSSLKLIGIATLLVLAVLGMLVVFDFVPVESVTDGLRYLLPALGILVVLVFGIGMLSKPAR